MSVIINIKTVAKKILKCTEDQFIQRRSRGNYQTEISKVTKLIMDNLDIFGCNSRVIEENVPEKKMYNAVKRLLTKKDLNEVDIYTFPKIRSSKSGNFIFLINHVSEITSTIIVVSII